MPWIITTGGVSVKSAEYAWRVNYLRSVPAGVRFVSAEPLLGPLPSLNLEGIDWVIAGGESQPGARPASLDWFRDLRDQCRTAEIAYFLKQLGGHPGKRGGREARLDGRRWTQLPLKTKSALPICSISALFRKKSSACGCRDARSSRYSGAFCVFFITRCRCST
jgi:protein gp37